MTVHWLNESESHGRRNDERERRAGLGGWGGVLVIIPYNKCSVSLQNLHLPHFVLEPLKNLDKVLSEPSTVRRRA